MVKICAYHYPCADGIFGALGAYLSGEPFTFVPLSILSTEQSRIDTFAQTLQSDDELYIVDFTGGPLFIAACCAKAKSVIILDHHKTGAEDLASPTLTSLTNLTTQFDMTRSGATISRDYFNIPSKLHSTRPSDADRILQLFTYIEDNDLWRHALPDSKLFSAGFQSLGFDFDARKDGGAIFEKILALNVDNVISKGREVIVEQDKIIADELTRAFTISIPYGEEGKKFEMIAVLTKYPDYRSTMGNLLATKSLDQGFMSVGAVVYEEEALGDSLFKVSLRSTGDLDTTVVSKFYNGGGHKNASSFNILKTVFDTWRNA